MKVLSCSGSAARLLCAGWLVGLLIATLIQTAAEAQQTEVFKVQACVDPKIAECLAAGHQALETRDLKEAARSFSSCVEKHPNTAITRYWLGMAYFFGHENEKAIAEFKEVTRLEPENAYAAAMLGRIYSFDQNKLGIAKELLERALAINSELEDARFDLARVCAQQGELEKAFKEFGIIFSGEARYALFHTELAKILITAGDTKEAHNQLQRALALAPDFEPAKRLLENLEKQRSSDPGEPATPADKSTAPPVKTPSHSGLLVSTIQAP